MSERTALAAGVMQALCDRIEALRAGLPLAPTVAADLATRIARVRAGMVGAVNLASLAAGAGDLCDVLHDLGREADPAQAEPQLAAVLAQVTTAVPISASPAVNQALDLGRTIAACIEAALLAEVAVAIASRTYTDRREALAAGDRLVAAAEPSLERIAQLGGEDLWRAASDAVRHAVDHLNRGVLDLKPVVLVEAIRSLPATVLAWRLYGDPARAAELVARNGIATPLFMPTSFEALSS